MVAVIGPSIPATPPTNAILKILDPTIFPNSILNSPFLTSEIEAANSGRLVPIATKVKPTNSSGTPARVAKFFAPNTRVSDPAHNAAVAIKIIVQESKIEVGFISSSSSESFFRTPLF
mgnify:CR=1 FL=1